MRASLSRAPKRRRNFRTLLTPKSVRDFFRERLEFYLKDARGYAYDVVNAVLAVDSDDVVDAVARAEAVSKVRGLGRFRFDFQRLQTHEEHFAPGGGKYETHCASVDPAGLQEDSEKELAALVPRTAAAVEKLRATRDYEAALLEIAKLRPAIDNFFDKVMVMVDDDNLRANRLALLQTVGKEFSYDRRFFRDRDRRQGICENNR